MSRQIVLIPFIEVGWSTHCGWHYSLNLGPGFCKYRKGSEHSEHGKAAEVAVRLQGDNEAVEVTVRLQR